MVLTSSPDTRWIRHKTNGDRFSFYYDMQLIVVSLNGAVYSRFFYHIYRLVFAPILTVDKQNLSLVLLAQAQVYFLEWITNSYFLVSRASLSNARTSEVYSI